MLNSKRRIVYGMSGNVLAQIVNVSIQLAGVPVLLKYWGINYYGEWLVLVTIPSYIEISDFGLGTSATAEMIMLQEAGDTHKVSELFRNAFWFILLVGLIPFILLYLTCYIFSWYDFLGFEKISTIDFQYAFVFLILYVYLSLFLTLPLGYYRVRKLYHRERYISIIFKLLEFGSLVFVVANGYGVTEAALAFLITKTLYFITIILDLKYKFPDFRVGVFGFDIRKIRHLLKPSAALMIIYLGQNVLTQGLTTSIGIILGSTQVVIYNTTRTMINFTRQVVSIVNLSFISEFSYAFGMREMRRLSRLFFLVQQMNIGLSFLCLGMLWVAGQYILDYWTRGEVSIEQPFYLLLILATFVNSWWNGGLAFLVATNKQYRTGIYFLVFSAVALAAAILVMNSAGLPVVALALLSFELIMSVLVFKECQKIVPLSFGHIFKWHGSMKPE